MRESLDFKNIFKRETKLASYIIICLTIVVISLSYAMFFQVDENSVNQEVVAGDLTFTYSEGNVVTSQENSICFEPMTSDEASLFPTTCGYEFSVTNTGTLKAAYTLKLIASAENEVNPSKLKVILRKRVGDTYELIESYPKTIDTLMEDVLLTNDLMEKETIVYNVQIYVEEKTYTQDDNKKVSYYIEGTGVVHEDQKITDEKKEETAVDKILEISKTDTTNLIYDETVDNNLRYIGQDPNNYVSFNNELWRIIGVMNNIEDETGNKKSRIKLIRDESIGLYGWDFSSTDINNGAGVNEWSESDLMKLLNPGFETNEVGGSLYWNRGSGKCYGIEQKITDCNFTLTGLDENSRNMIGKALWNTGANSEEVNGNDVMAIQFYDFERSDTTSKICSEEADGICNDQVNRKTTWLGNVATLYPSDYVLATSGGTEYERNACLNYKAYNWNELNDCFTNNWLYKSNSNFWTMMPFADYSNATFVYYVSDHGNMYGMSAYQEFYVYPALYLKETVKIIDGNGTKGNPFILK